MGEKWENICSSVNTCALNGASNFFAGIPKAHIISNGPLWCYFYALRYLEKSHLDLDNRFQCAQLDNNAVVYGTEACLLKAINLVDSMSEPELLALENSCAISLIGDDLAGIARKANLKYPVIDLDTGGLIGGFNEGYVLASKRLFEKIGLNKNLVKKKKQVNLLGCTYGHYNAYNDLQELQAMLIKGGYTVGAIPGAGSNLDAIKNIPAAELNLVVNSELGLELAQFLEKNYQMPYLEIGMPYGIGGSINWLKKIKQYIDTDLSQIIAEAQTKEKSILAAIGELKSTWGELWFDTAIVAGPSNIALNIAEALRLEWADMDNLIVITHDNKTREKLPTQADKIINSSSNGEEIEDIFENISNNSLFLASSIEKTAVMRHNITPKVFCNITYPVQDEILLTNNPFVGINGAACMLEKIWNQKINAQLLGN